MTIHNLDIHEINQYQQNRYPCLFVDFIEEINPGVSATGYKAFSINEWFSQAFKTQKVVPGYIVCEACEQVFLMTFLSLPENKGKKTSTISFNASFSMDVHIGDRLEIKATLESFRRGLAKGKSLGYVNGILACEAEFMVNIPDQMSMFTPKSGAA